MLSDISKAVRDGIVKDSSDSAISLQAKRREWEDAISSLPLPQDIVLEREKIAAVDCLWVRNSRCSDSALIVYVHGGGMVEGSAITHQEFAARLSSVCDANILLIDYRLSPEFVYPAARQDVESVLQALQDNQGVPDVVYMGGESSGAGLLLSALTTLKSKNSVLVSKMFLISGVYDLTFSGSSIRDLSAVDPFTSIDVLKNYTELYAPEMDKAEPGLSPLFADLSGLPQALILVGSDEILLSDSQRLSEALLQYGVDANLEVWPDMWHAWPMYAALPEADKALLRIAEFLRS